MINYNDPRLLDKFYYCENSKSGLRIKSPDKYRPADSEAGYIQKSEKFARWAVKFNGKNYMVHRIIWYLFHGKVDDGLVIDHLNGNALDNRIGNLRLVTQGVNNKNHKKQKNNNSGMTGVYFSETWRAQWVDSEGNQRSKRFESFEDACKFRETKMLEIQEYTERHGK